MRIRMNPRLMLLFILLPLACGERSSARLDGASPASDTAATDTNSASEDMPPGPDLVPNPDVVPLIDFDSPPCCKEPICSNHAWYDPCDNQLIKLQYNCSIIEVACMDCGPGCKDNGFYIDSPVFGLERLLACDCQACKPECQAIGSKSEGWYDSCTKTLIKHASCNSCKVICFDPIPPRTGLPQPRYYSSCDKTTPLTKTPCVP